MLGTLGEVPVGARWPRPAVLLSVLLLLRFLCGDEVESEHSAEPSRPRLRYCTDTCRTVSQVLTSPAILTADAEGRGSCQAPRALPGAGAAADGCSCIHSVVGARWVPGAGGPSL